MSEEGATPRVLHLVFTDVAESAALKEAHGDQAAGRILERERTELVRLAAECSGRIVDFAGDGCFLTFETASAAVLFALRLQELHASQADLPRVRVGIHVGEVSERAQPTGDRAARVEGLAVDLASRIQGLASPGQVLVSSAVAASARQRLEREVEGRAVRWLSHGRFALKGASEPVEVLEVGLEGIAVFTAPHAGDKAKPVARPRRARVLTVGIAGLVVLAALAYTALRTRTSPELAPIRAIAVLPLENLSGDPEQEYFADGMTDAMIGELAKIGALKVISRTSVMQYKGAHRPLREIARELGVDAVIEGTVLRAGEQVRITAQLIDARDDHHLWAQSYERELAAVLQIQSEVARAVASQIEIALAPHEATRLAAPKPVDARAQDAYLKGLHRLGLLNPVAATEAIANFEEAIRIAPDYAPAYAALSQANPWLGFRATNLMDRAALEGARTSALSAIELDSDLAAAHVSLAEVLWNLDWNWPETEREYLRALELNPSAAGASTAYPIFLAHIGRRNEAVVRADQAVELAPLDLGVRVRRAALYVMVGLPERALSDTAWILEIEPGHVGALLFDALSKQALGRYEDAALAFHRYDERLPPGMQQFSGLERAWREGGSGGYFDEMTRSMTTHGNLLGQAATYAIVGNGDGAFDVLEKAYAAKDIAITFLLTAYLDPLRKDPRFADLARRMNLPVPEDAMTH